MHSTYTCVQYIAKGIIIENMLHSLDTGHRPMYDSPEVLATDCCRTRLFIKESLKIQECKAFKSLNGNQGSFDLQLW